jgi:hypothetical protein
MIMCVGHFSVDPRAAVFTVGRKASGLAWDRHLVLCARLGLLREVSQTQAAEWRHATTCTTAIYQALFLLNPLVFGSRASVSCVCSSAPSAVGALVTALLDRMLAALLAVPS